MKITTHLDHISHCKTWSDRLTNRAFIINSRRNEISRPARTSSVWSQPHHSVEYGAFVGSKFDRNVTKLAAHEALKFIA